jgi:chemotaxis protein methyltransferase CheR
MFNKGEFKTNSFREDGSSFHPLLEPFICRQESIWTLEDSLRRKIKIQQINLFHDDLEALTTRFNLIFLRNMLVYMPLDIRERILDKMVKVLAEDGYLFLASTETPLMYHPTLQLKEYHGVYFFQKKNFQDTQRGFSFNQELSKAIKEKPKPSIKKSLIQNTPKKNIEKYSANVEEVLHFANQKLNNRLFSVENNINYSLSLQFLEVVFFINANKSSEARNVLDSIQQMMTPNEISLYLLGYLEMVEQHEKKAISQFMNALQRNNSFWLARFYLGMLLQKTSPQKALREFTICQENIASYLQNNRYDYQFLLEGFNAKYFLNMCRKLINKLDSSKSQVASRQVASRKS